MSRDSNSIPFNKRFQPTWRAVNELNLRHREV